jgi:hypothetical protein
MAKVAHNHNFFLQLFYLGISALLGAPSAQAYVGVKNNYLAARGEDASCDWGCQKTSRLVTAGEVQLPGSSPGRDEH